MPAVPASRPRSLPSPVPQVHDFGSPRVALRTRISGFSISSARVVFAAPITVRQSTPANTWFRLDDC